MRTDKHTHTHSHTRVQAHSSPARGVDGGESVRSITLLPVELTPPSPLPTPDAAAVRCLWRRTSFSCICRCVHERRCVCRMQCVWCVLGDGHERGLCVCVLWVKEWIWVSLVSNLLRIRIGLFCKRVLYKGLYAAKETYNLKEPTHRSH